MKETTSTPSSSSKLPASCCEEEEEGEEEETTIIIEKRRKWVDCYQEHCIYLPAMLGWFILSACLSSYNKEVFGIRRFPCPLFMTSIHFFMQWSFSYMISSIEPEIFDGYQVSSLSWSQFLSISIPCGLITSLDVGLSNLSLVRISITFFTMIKASAPIFVVLSAYLFGIERITPILILVVLIIACGEVLTVVGEGLQFDLLGFQLCLSASVLSGMRWTVVQYKLRRMEPRLRSSWGVMRVLSPSMFVSLVIFSLVIERPWEMMFGDEDRSVYFRSWKDGSKTMSLGMLGGLMAILMIFCEFYLIMKSNAIVLMIGGVVKEMFTIFVGVTFFHDKLNKINITGCLIVFIGVGIYKVSYHRSKMEREAAEATETSNINNNNNNDPNVEYRPVLNEDDHINGDSVKVKNGGLLLLKNKTVDEEEETKIREKLIHDGGTSEEDDIDDVSTLEMSTSSGCENGIQRLKNYLEVDGDVDGVTTITENGGDDDDGGMETNNVV